MFDLIWDTSFAAVCLDLNKPTAVHKLLQDYLAFVGTLIPHDSRHASLTSSRTRALVLRSGIRPLHKDIPLVPGETYERYRDKGIWWVNNWVGGSLIYDVQLRELQAPLKWSKQTYKYAYTAYIYIL